MTLRILKHLIQQIEQISKLTITQLFSQNIFVYVTHFFFFFDHFTHWVSLVELEFSIIYTKSYNSVFIYIRMRYVYEFREWMLKNQMEVLAWRGLAYTGFLLHFVLVCQLLLLQPLSVLGLYRSLFFRSLFMLKFWFKFLLLWEMCKLRSGSGFLGMFLCFFFFF